MASTVSIIIPHHNRLLFLEQQLNEYAKWVKDDLEFLIIDNSPLCISDQNRLVSTYTWARFIFVKENNGPSHLRNIGLKLANGKFIQFIDDDDFVTYQKVKSQMNYLNKEVNTSVVIGATQKENWDTLRKIKERTEAISFPDFSTVISISDLLKTENFFQIGSALFRKNNLLEIGGFDESRWFIEDVHLYLRLFEAGAIIKTGKNLTHGFFFRIHDRNSLSKSSQTKFLEGCLLNFLYCIDHNMLRTEQDYKIVYSGIYNFLNQNTIINQEIYLKGIKELKNQSFKYLPKIAVIGKLIGMNNLFKTLSFYRRIKLQISH